MSTTIAPNPDLRSLTMNLAPQINFVTETCCACGLLFAMTKGYRQALLDKPGTTFYCPAGHSQSYTGTSEAERLQRRAAELERRLASRDDDLRAVAAQLEDARRSHAVTKGQLTKVRKRADAGVCQHCKRSFVNVARHVATQHATAAARGSRRDGMVRRTNAPARHVATKHAAAAVQ